jgi:YHS domain-containing protein
MGSLHREKRRVLQEVIPLGRRRTACPNWSLAMTRKLALALSTSLFVTGALAIVAVATPTTQPAAAAPTTQPVNKLCPISHEAIDPAVTVVYDGKVIAFCCRDCLAKFNADPQKYIADVK